MPANVHLLGGNASKLAQADLDSRNLAVPAAVPPRPDWLSDEAVTEWDRIAPLLVELGLISELDLAALAGYCQAYATFAGAQRVLRMAGSKGYVDFTPNGMRVMSVNFQIANRAEESMRKYLTDFGLSPAARARLRATPQQGSLFPDSDPMETFLQAGKRAE